MFSAVYRRQKYANLSVNYSYSSIITIHSMPSLSRARTKILETTSCNYIKRYNSPFLFFARSIYSALDIATNMHEAIHENSHRRLPNNLECDPNAHRTGVERYVCVM